MRGRVVVAGLSSFLTLACGSSEGGSGGAGAGSGGTGAGNGGSAGAPGGSSGSSSGGTGPGAGGSSSATGGSSGAPVGDCAASFPTSRLLFAGEENNPPGSLSVSDDELELYYSLSNLIYVRRRAARSDAFGDAIELTELSSTCAATNNTASVDVTGDGLRLYFACHDTTGPIRLATRADRNSPFVVDPTTYGTIEASLSVTTDELTLFSVVSNGENAQALIHTRATRSEPFGPGSSIPGINQLFRFPELSANGSTLFGSTLPTPGLWRLARATRDSTTGSFSTPTNDNLPVPLAVPDDPATTRVEGGVDYTPTVGGDCRSIYFLRGMLTGGTVNYSWTVEVAER